MSLHPQRTTHGGMPNPRTLGFNAAPTKLPRVNPFFLGSLMQYACPGSFFADLDFRKSRTR
eukprot:3875172-Alexandrium_andersonii.AAC.1